MYGNRETVAVGLMLSRIRAGKEMNRLGSMHISVINVGPYYYVQHWNTKIAVGVRGELPFAMHTNGWNTVTTLNYLRALGFDLCTKRISVGKYRNPETNRIKNDFRRVLHVDGVPMLNDAKNGEDYESWWGHGGVKLPSNYF